MPTLMIIIYLYDIDDSVLIYARIPLCFFKQIHLFFAIRNTKGIKKWRRTFYWNTSFFISAEIAIFLENCFLYDVPYLFLEHSLVTTALKVTHNPSLSFQLPLFGLTFCYRKQKMITLITLHHCPNYREKICLPRVS